MRAYHALTYRMLAQSVALAQTHIPARSQPARYASNLPRRYPREDAYIEDTTPATPMPGRPPPLFATVAWETLRSCLRPRSSLCSKHHTCAVGLGHVAPPPHAPPRLSSEAGEVVFSPVLALLEEVVVCLPVIARIINDERSAVDRTYTEEWLLVCRSERRGHRH